MISKFKKKVYIKKQIIIRHNIKTRNRYETGLNVLSGIYIDSTEGKDTTPIDLTGSRTADEVAQEHPEKTIVSVGDRESDTFELFILAMEESSKAQLLLRAAQNRRVADKETIRLWAAAESSKELGTKTLVLSKTENKDLSPIELSVRACKVTITVVTLTAPTMDRLA